VSNFIVEEFHSMDYGPAPEDPKEVDRWLEAHQRNFDHYIGGVWKKPASGEYFATSNPATGDKIADVAYGDAADVDAAVKAARKALPSWQALSSHQRGISMRWHARCRNTHAASRFLKRSTTANQSARAAILISPLWLATFIITRDGHSYWGANFRVTLLVALWGR
jgi:hypothetical protein